MKSFVVQISYSQNGEIEKTGASVGASGEQGRVIGTTGAKRRDDLHEASGCLREDNTADIW